MGVLHIKRSVLTVTLILILLIFSACGVGQDGSGTPEDTISDAVVEMPATHENETTAQDSTVIREQEEKAVDEPDQATTQPDGEDEQGELLQSASVDLDGDGQNEQVKAIRVLSGAKESGVTGEVEGRLVIEDTKSKTVVTFRKKQDELNSIMTGMQFEDLDGDGAADVFIVIPGSGASFEYYSYFIYSYKKNASHTFSSDNTLAEFIDGFEIAYINGSNKLTISNEQYNFSVDLAIESVSQEEQSETMQDYVNSTWIEPVSVHIDEESRLSLINNTEYGPQIKVPLPIFGLATVDMIGEIDLFFSVDDDFMPVLERFELLDFAGNEKVRVGSSKVR
jgi:hypothetical protein